MSSDKLIGIANIRGILAISMLLGSSQVQALALPCINGDVGGQVFLELPVNGASVANTYGVKDANESGLEGISVSVVDANGVSQTPVTTDENGAWTVKGPAFPVRVQFKWNQSWLQNSTGGSDSNTSVQFVTASSCDTQFGLHDPGSYSQTNPGIALTCQVNGTGVGNSDPGLVSTAYTSTGLNSTYFTYPGDNTGTQGTGPVPATDATVDQVGSTWGVAWQANQSRLFVSTFLKRHIGMADGPGYVYVVDYSGASASLAHKFNLAGIQPANGGSAIDLGAVCRDSACASNPGNTGIPADYELPASKLDPSHDLDAFAKVGTISFGDIDMQSGSNTLWLVNTFQNALISMDVNAASTLLPLANSVNQYPIALMAGVPTCNNGIMRPWALSFFRGKGYLGAVCDGSSGNGSDIDVKAYVLSFDPDDIAAGVSTELDFALNYARTGPGLVDFHYWIYDYASPPISEETPGVRTFYPQPILSDIEFDPAGNMYLNIMDRMSHQIGHQNYKPLSGDTTLISNLATGEMLKACTTTSGFVLEGGAGCAVNFTSFAGPFATGEFFEDTSGDTRLESANGAFLSLMGSNEIVSVVVDPHPSNPGNSDPTDSTYWHTQGMNTYSLSSGLITNWYGVNYSDSIALSGKGNGLGDIELLTDVAPVEIGNRVWNDANKNGLQDANEVGIDGVAVVLSCGTDTVTTTTANGGQYYFSNAASVVAGVTQASFMDWGESCTLSVEKIQGALTGLDLTTVNADNDQTNSPFTDVLDSDAVLNSGKAEIAVTVGQAGENNHSLDFGFSNVPLTYDFGDAPDSYGTTLGATGAQHQIDPNLKMGPTEDSEVDGQPSVLVDGDGEDEDGVAFPSPLLDGQALTITVMASNSTGFPANLFCWIDYNGDGSFAADGTESGSAGVANGSDNTQIPVVMPNVPANASTATAGFTYIRCRLTTAVMTAASSTGLAADGEVEDYRVPIDAVTVCSLNPVISSSCDDNGTLSNRDDDRFSYSITVTGSNTGASASYNISGGDSQTGLGYGELAGPFPGFLISDGNLTLTLTDASDSRCTLSNVSVTAPAPCSRPGDQNPPDNDEGGTIVHIPTLSEWMLVLLSSLIALLAWMTGRQSRID